MTIVIITSLHLKIIAQAFLQFYYKPKNCNKACRSPCLFFIQRNPDLVIIINPNRAFRINIRIENRIEIQLNLTLHPTLITSQTFNFKQTTLIKPYHLIKSLIMWIFLTVNPCFTLKGIRMLIRNPYPKHQQEKHRMLMPRNPYPKHLDIKLYFILHTRSVPYLYQSYSSFSQPY